MVGHTGNLEAATAAIGHISKCLEKLVPAFIAKGGIFIITADHGNADEMYFEKKDKEVVSTQHSLNKVPFWVLGKEIGIKDQGIIPDVGVTILDLIGLQKTPDMTAQTLIIR